MLNPVAAPVSAYTEGTSITYGTGARIAEAKSASLSWDRSDGRFYGDDVQLDSDNGINGYTLDFEPTGLTDAARALLLGEVASSGSTATGEYSVTADAAPDVGFGYVRVMRTTGDSGVVTSYEGWWFYKIKFGVSSEETRTKEQTIEWRTPTLSGTGSGVVLAADGKVVYAVHKTFATKAAAIDWVDGKAGL
jgi:phi13 family phage major tail protein